MNYAISIKEYILIFYALESGCYDLLPHWYNPNELPLNRGVYKLIYNQCPEVVSDLKYKPDQVSHGWLIERLERYDALFYGRREYWKDIQEYCKGNLEKDQVNLRCTILQYAESQKCLGELSFCLERIAKDGLTSEVFEYFLDWLLFSCGHPAYSSPPVPPAQVYENASDVLCQEFDPCLMLLYPYDYLGDLYFYACEEDHFYDITHEIGRQQDLDVLNARFVSYALRYRHFDDYGKKDIEVYIDPDKYLQYFVTFDHVFSSGREYLVQGNFYLHGCPVTNDRIIGKIMLVNFYFYVPWYAAHDYHNLHYLPSLIKELQKEKENNKILTRYTNKVLAYCGLNQWAEVDWDLYPSLYPVIPVKHQSDRDIVMNLTPSSFFS